MRVVLNLDESKPTFGVQEKRITVESHLFQFFIHFTDADGKVTLTTPPSHISIATTVLIDCLYSFCRKFHTCGKKTHRTSDCWTVPTQNRKRNPSHQVQDLGKGNGQMSQSSNCEQEFRSERMMCKVQNTCLKKQLYVVAFPGFFLLFPEEAPIPERLFFFLRPQAIPKRQNVSVQGPWRVPERRFIFFRSWRSSGTGYFSGSWNSFQGIFLEASGRTFVN